MLGMAPVAGAAPSCTSDVERTVNQLEAEGYNVIMNRIGAQPADNCTVANVRPGQTYSRTDSGVPNNVLDAPGPNIATTITGESVYVDVRC